MARTQNSAGTGVVTGQREGLDLEGLRLLLKQSEPAGTDDRETRERIGAAIARAIFNSRKPESGELARVA
jgi:hypothetical protein